MRVVPVLTIAALNRRMSLIGPSRRLAQFTGMSEVEVTAESGNAPRVTEPTLVTLTGHQHRHIRFGPRRERGRSVGHDDN